MSYATLDEVYGGGFTQPSSDTSTKNVSPITTSMDNNTYDINDENLECNFFLDHISKCTKCQKILKKKFGGSNSNSDEWNKKKNYIDKDSHTQKNKQLMDRQFKNELRGKIDPEMLKELQGYDYDDISQYLQIKKTKGLKLKKDPLNDCLSCKDDIDKIAKDLDAGAKEDSDSDSDSEDGDSKEGFLNWGSRMRRRIRRRRRRRRLRERALELKEETDNSDIAILLLLGIFTIFAVDSLTKMGKKN